MKDKLLKVVTWRVLSILITLSFLFLLTGDVKTATGITLILHCVLTVAHFIFEAAWEGFTDEKN